LKSNYVVSVFVINNKCTKNGVKY